MRTLPLALLLAVGAGCAPLPTSQNEQPIIGGTTTSADPGVVLVLAQSQSANGGASICTGEVVSPHVVLTAAHCVDPATVGTGNDFFIFLGTDLNDATQVMNQALVYAAASTSYNTAFDPNVLDGGNDIGAVVTKKALPITPLVVNRTPIDDSMVGQTLRLVGYGINKGTDSQGTSAGVKRTVSTPLSEYDDKFIAFGNAQKNTCEGDSGGPAFLTVNGVEVIAGITSFGDRGCKNGGVDTRVDVYVASFLDPIIAAADPQTPPDGGTVSNPDGGLTVVDGGGNNGGGTGSGNNGGGTGSGNNGGGTGSGNNGGGTGSGNNGGGTGSGNNGGGNSGGGTGGIIQPGDDGAPCSSAVQCHSGLCTAGVCGGNGGNPGTIGGPAGGGARSGCSMVPVAGGSPMPVIMLLGGLLVRRRRSAK